MADENNDDRRNKISEGLWMFLKVVCFIVAGLLLLAVIAFGLLVGFCALQNKL